VRAIEGHVSKGVDGTSVKAVVDGNSMNAVVEHEPSGESVVSKVVGVGNGYEAEHNKVTEIITCAHMIDLQSRSS
jgi:hypothetical protein